jgi:hypothetical protein
MRIQCMKRRRGSVCFDRLKKTYDSKCHLYMSLVSIGIQHSYISALCVKERLVNCTYSMYIVCHKCMQDMTEFRGLKQLWHSPRADTYFCQPCRSLLSNGEA